MRHFYFNYLVKKITKKIKNIVILFSYFFCFEIQVQFFIINFYQIILLKREIFTYYCIVINITLKNKIKDKIFSIISYNFK